MPELPEVEVVRRGLADLLPGRTITGVQVLHPRSVRRHVGGGDDFVATLVGRTFGIPQRRGKYLWIPFLDGDALLTHLGMSAQFRMEPGHHEHDRHTRVVVRFADDGPELRFADQRLFGGLALSRGGAVLPAEVAHIALDPFDPRFEPQLVANRIRMKSSAIKRVLLDQTVVSGIGNIYADEALWRAGLHGERLARTLSVEQILSVLDAARAVMAAAIDAGGTSFDALYVNVNGRSGYFSRSLNVYGRAGLACPRCGGTIVREPFMNRSSHVCRACQPPPSR